MRYYKLISGGYLLSVGVGLAGDEITETEYNTILETIHSAPTAPDGYGYRLTDSLEWELYEIPVVEVEVEATDTDYQSALREMGVKV